MTRVTNKFDYKSLSRVTVNGKRNYKTPLGCVVASVTTILDSTKDKTHLYEWRKRVGEQKAQEIASEASGVGTRMHKYIEKYIETGEWPAPGTNPYAQQALSMANKIKEKAIVDVDEVWGSEVSLYFPKIYAGTTDLVGTYKGSPCIFDFKQTNKPKKPEWVEDYLLQITAYALAHNEIYGTNIQEGHIFMCSRDLQYQQFDLWPSDFKEWENKWWQRCEMYYEKYA